MQMLPGCSLLVGLRLNVRTWVTRVVPAEVFKELRSIQCFLELINSLHTAKFMFSYHHRLLPHSFVDLFVTNIQIPSYDTRRATKYRSHQCRTSMKYFTVLYQGPKIWNSLPSGIIRSDTLFGFQKMITQFSPIQLIILTLSNSHCTNSIVEGDLPRISLVVPGGLLAIPFVY